MTQKIKILASVYAVNPYKGSEDGTGWQWVLQIADKQNVTAITRKNNRDDIERYMKENPNEIYQNIDWQYYDLPYFLRFWKKGARGAMFYYLLWQLFIPIFIIKNKLTFHILHNLNFHNDWTPSYLWILGKPFVWGPVGHHPEIPKNFLKYSFDKKEHLKHSATNIIKKYFWNIDPFLKLCKWNADHIIGINSTIKEVLNLADEKLTVLPAVACETGLNKAPIKNKDTFTIISIGRFVPLKGFDLCLKSFAKFYHNLNQESKPKVKLQLIGKGPQLDFLKNLAKKLEIINAVEFIAWMDRVQLKEKYQSSHLFLFPSHEGAGMVVPEALSFGLPVVCLNNCGPGEMVDESCGRIASYENPTKTVEELSNFLKDLYYNRVLLFTLSKGALKQYKTKFTWNRKGEALNKIYTKILANYESSNSMYTSTQ